MQEGYYITFYIKALKEKVLMLSTYEKEMLALVSTVNKWRPYLLGHFFKIRTDQEALKYQLEEKLDTEP